VESYLREQIPLSAAMDIRVLESGPDRVRIQAPLEPNLNHSATAFGGSVAALALLAGWTLVQTGLERAGVAARTVIHETSIRYDAPIESAFTAACEAPEPEAWERFLHTLRRRGRARIRVTIRVESGGRVAATAEGAYVALAEAAEAREGA
jgi:thioesterase domain-containing protein